MHGLHGLHCPINNILVVMVDYFVEHRTLQIAFERALGYLPWALIQLILACTLLQSWSINVSVGWIWGLIGATLKQMLRLLFILLWSGSHADHLSWLLSGDHALELFFAFEARHGPISPRSSPAVVLESWALIHSLMLSAC